MRVVERGEPHAFATILRLAAASDGASLSLRARARELGPDEGIGGITIWPTLALAAREGEDLTPYHEAVHDYVGPERGELLLAWADASRIRNDAVRMEDALQNLNAELRGFAHLMGLLVLGPEAPVAWHEEVEALLFSSERP